MTKLKTIDLGNLGIKAKNQIPLMDFEKFSNPKRGMKVFEDKMIGTPYTEKMSKSKTYSNYSNSFSMNNKFLKYVNIIINIKDKPGQYFDEQVELEKDLETEKFTIPKLPTKTIPLTFRKFFYQTLKKDITKLSLKDPEKVPILINQIANSIWEKSQGWLNFVADKQVSMLICQTDNYANKAKVYKKSNQFQNIPEVIQWIIDTNLKMRYPSSDWNKDGTITFSEDQENLLIIDSFLFQSIEITEEWESRQDREKSKIPLPLHKVWERFASLIVFPLKNNFQFIIINKKALIGWKDFQDLEVKYDEDNSTTYFLRKMEGGFKQLTNYNAIAYIQE